MERDLASLADIHRSACEIMAMRTRFTLRDVEEDDVLTSALLHKAILIGEAANRVSDAGQARWPLPWREMTGMRNVLVHDYDAVDLGIVWQMAEQDLPALVAQIEAILPELAG
jgi:uncharacterized protein with HEPN domain